MHGASNCDSAVDGRFDSYLGSVGARSTIGSAENAASKLYMSHTAMLIWLANPTVIGSSPIVR